MRWVHAVLVEGRTFDEAMALGDDQALEARDRGFARLIAATVLRRRGSIDYVIGQFLQSPLPVRQGRLSAILQTAAAQVLFLDTPPHAAISLAVDQCRLDRHARRFDKLANAVLRRVSERGRALLDGLDVMALDIPSWIAARWADQYGAETARGIAIACLQEAPLDLTVVSDAEGWANRLGGIVLPTGSVRLAAAGRVDALAGYDDGQWWVQDAAAALPARLLGDVSGKRVADLCAAPGGKTAELAIAGAIVTAVDQSELRLSRLASNLARLKLEVRVVTSDILHFEPEQAFDAVLLDAPCTATGTIRRHPDILHVKTASDITRLAEMQSALLAKAATLVMSGGTLVYCTCSLEREEGVDQIERFLAANPRFQRRPISPEEIGGAAEWITPAGDLRTLPSHLQDLAEGLRGLDGFYAARLIAG